jgi:hypothetical protein
MTTALAPDTKRMQIEEHLRRGESTQAIADSVGATVSYINWVRQQGEFPPPPPRRQRRRTGIRSEKRREIERRILNNERSVDIARAVGVSVSYVTAIQRMSGLRQSRERRAPSPPRVIPAMPPAAPPQPTLRSRIEARLRAGGRSKAIADEFGVDISYVSHVRKLAGLPRVPAKTTPRRTQQEANDGVTTST